jgi:hypothetical protein
MDSLDQYMVVMVKYYMMVDKQDFVEVFDRNHMVPLSRRNLIIRMSYYKNNLPGRRHKGNECGWKIS